VSSSRRVTRTFFYKQLLQETASCPQHSPEDQIEELFKRTEKEEGYSLTVNLPNQTIADKTRPNLQI